MSFGMKRLRTRLLGTCVGVACGNMASANVLTDILQTMTPNSWQQMNLNQFQEAWTPLLQRPTVDDPSTNISAWSGAAWDSMRKDILIWGGDIGNEQGNEVYIFRTTTGLWERGALPSQITQTNGITHTVDGIYNAPVSGESWDNVVYLQNVDRMAVIGVSREGQTFQNLEGAATGPYFWDPSRADSNKVSGLTGSNVDPLSYPDVQGGQMWQNRDNFAPGVDSAQWGTSAYVNKDGKDVVYFTAQYDNLWRYTVYDLDPTHDSWELIGKRPRTGVDSDGSGAFDNTREIYLKTLGTDSFGFWDINHPGTPEDNREIAIIPTNLSGETLGNIADYGLQYDPILDAFTLWGGDEKIWLLTPPDNLDPDGDGILSEATGWTLSLLNPDGREPFLPDAYTGVFGKWIYMPEEQAYVGVIDPEAGDVFVYKPAYNAMPVPIPAPVWLLLSGLGTLYVRRVKRNQRQSNITPSPSPTHVQPEQMYS